MESLQRRRQMRIYQERHRGKPFGPQTKYENAAVIAAWANGNLSEGQVASALGIDRVEARRLYDNMCHFGVTLVEALRQPRASRGRPKAKRAVTPSASEAL